MGLTHWISLASALVFLFVAILAASNAKRSPLAAPLGRTCAALFAYDALEVLKHLTGRDELFALECAAAALVAPTTAALVIRFLGEWRRLRPLVLAGAVYFSLVALACIAAVVVPALRDFPGSEAWAMALLLGIVPEFGYLFVRLWAHARVSDAAERTRTQLLVLALVLGVGGASSDLVSIAGAATPRLAALGLIAGALVLAALSLRYELLERVETLAAVYAGAIGSVALLAHLFLLAVLGEQPTLLALLMVAVTLAAVATLRPLLAMRSESRARTAYLVTLGRFSAQMAHDVKNPLAAIRGAAQFLREERAQGRSIDDQAMFVDLIVEQTERLERVIQDYQRLGRAEAQRAPVTVRALVDEVAEAQRAASSKHTIRVEVDEDGLEAALDRDLVLGALENLVRNAREAMPEGGHVTLRARRASTHAIVLEVEDDGPGMDVRTQEQAFDDFFTTKATGSGLGLAFVGRVATAHHGSARLEAVEPHGTRVVLTLQT
ncbi:MAG: two-component sensor histidine kinase [Sandaracinaceae bacterium]|nr:two-component sensor histidine kinase [Sandaracinaceae bacterium]